MYATEIAARKLKPAVAAVVLAILTGCSIPTVIAGERYPPYKPKPVLEYPTCQVRDGVCAAVEPLLDKGEQERFLGANLTAQGYVPVYLVLENQAGHMQNPFAALAGLPLVGYELHDKFGVDKPS